MGNKTLQRILVAVFGLAFIGSTGAIVMAGLFSNKNATSPTASNNTPSLEEQAEIQARGYEKVLEREPENMTALTGLVEIYLQTGNVDKAIPPLEKLVQFYPEQKEFEQILQVIKQQQAQQEPK
jgi:thioredoxin-like negative regulator of GroEL